MSEERVRFLLRISSSLKKKLNEMAQSEHRSLNGQIEYLLEKVVREESKTQDAVPGSASKRK